MTGSAWYFERVKDPVNPTSAEIEEWARTPGAMYPMEDWDLIIATDENSELFLRLAADPTCANHDAVMNFLYVYAGQVIREGRRLASVAALRNLINRAATIALGDIQLWAKRAAGLLDGRGPDPRSGAHGDDYEFWFGRGWRKANE
jgi:hypothetical protein